MGCVAQTMGWIYVFRAGSGGFNGDLQAEAVGSWEIEVFLMGLARTAVFLLMGRCRIEPAGWGQDMAEMGFHPDLLCLHEHSGATCPLG